MTKTEAHKSRRFLSLKWKVLTLTSLVLLSISISHITLNHIALVKQFETQSDITHKQYMVQVSGLIQRSAKRLQQIGGMLPILSGMKGPLVSESESKLEEAFNQHWPTLQIDMGIGLVRFYSKTNQLLGMWGDLQNDAPISSTVLGKVWYANEREQPVTAMDCSATCIQYTAVPMLADGQNIGVVLLGQSLADVILAFKQVSGTDIGVITTKNAQPVDNNGIGKWIPEWKADVIAITSPATTLNILHAGAAIQSSFQELLNGARAKWNEREYNIRLIPLNGIEGGEKTSLAVITDITDDLIRIGRDTRESWTTAMIGLFVTVAFLLILMWSPMSRIRSTSLRLPLLSEGKFDEARADVEKSQHWRIFDDETDVLDTTALDLSYQLEELENETRVFTDELKDRARELAIQKDFVTNLLDTAQAIIITQDSRGEITMLNQYCENLMGYNQNELLTFPFIRLISSDNISSMVIRELSDLVSGKITQLHHELTIRCKDGSKRDIAWFHSYSKRNDDETATVLSVGIDITDRKLAEVHARAAHYEKISAEAASLSKSAFLANMSHEIRTPLTAIIGFSESMLDGYQSEEEREQTIKTIIRSGQHLQQVINDILDLSKVEAGKLDVELIKASPFEIMDEVKPLIIMQAKDKDLKFSINYEFPMPEFIRTDKFRLRQILINLCNNAVKFTHHGSITINISCRPDINTMEFNVVDTGIGLSGNQKELIFGAFSQADSSTTRQYGGTGLGLYLSRQLANKLGGDITVDSEPGKGSAFTLTIDTGELDGVAMLSSAPKLALDSVSIPDISKLSLSGKLLLAEDNSDNQRLISLKVEQTGAEISIAENGHMAVDMALKQPYNLILMDIQMPVMNGLDATRTLRRKGYTGAIVALTANAMQEDIDACKAAGCDGFLTKPIKWNEFFEVLKNNLLPGQTQDGEAEAATTASADADISDEPEDEHSIAEKGNTELEPIRSTLLSDGNPNIINVVNQFIDYLPAQLEEIRNLYQDQDFTVLKERIHTIKGTAGNFGFMDITDVANSIETNLENRNFPEIEQHLSEFDQLYQRIKLGR